MHREKGHWSSLSVTIVSLTALVCVQPTVGAVLIGVDPFDGARGQLYTLSPRAAFTDPPETPVAFRATLRRPFGSGDTRGIVVQDLAFDPFGGILYGLDGANDELVTINPDTGIVEVIGPITDIGSTNGLVYLPFLNSLATIDLFTSDGINFSNGLVLIDPATAETNFIGTFADATSPTTFDGLGVNGLLYQQATNTLISVSDGPLGSNGVVVAYDLDSLEAFIVGGTSGPQLSLAQTPDGSVFSTEFLSAGLLNDFELDLLPEVAPDSANIDLDFDSGTLFLTGIASIELIPEPATATLLTIGCFTLARRLGY
ncbi:hypothetical protein [Mucisphaera calidilacus]|uniref:PEP-CTERM protein-sorting domain-containing protein n=1 Tax=Mucisphaera calidilacus TaxID=2527982 RepID=A0A518BX55_9BACT|nr:hypothetical protein [Mucisphaera calidilacus]QDU71555.1 hypothetical protein Pan265_14050 [Mucisphaera calidilacus]